MDKGYTITPREEDKSLIQRFTEPIKSFADKISPQNVFQQQSGDGYTIIPREQAEFIENTSVDLVDEGLKIHTKGQDPIIVKESDYTPEQQSLVEDLKMEREMDKSIKEAETSAMKTGKGGIPVYGSLDVMSRGIAGSITTRKVDETTERQWDNIAELRLDMGEMIREKAKEGDKEGAKALLDALKATTDDIEGITTELVDEAWAKTPNRQQVAGAGLELALLASMGYGAQYGQAGIKGIKPFVKVARTSKAFPLGASTSQKVMQKARQYGLASLKSGAELGIWSAAGEMKIEDATTEDIINAAEEGFKFGAVLGPAFHSAGDLTKYGMSKFIPKVKNLTTKTTKSLEKIAAGEAKVPESALEKALQGIEQPLTKSQKAANIALKGVDAIKKTEQKLLDSYAPIKRIEDSIQRITKRPNKGGEKLYRDIRMANPWADGLSLKKINNFKKSFEKYSPEIQEGATGYLNLLNNLDRAKMGLKVPGGKTAAQIKREIGELAIFMGKDNMKKIGQLRKTINRYTQSELSGMVRAGLIDEKQMIAMMKAHPNYLPNKVIMDNIERNTSAVGSSMNVSETSLKKAVGSIKEINNPIEAMLSRTIITNRVKEKNKILQNLIKAHKDYKVIPGANKLKSAEKAKEGFGSISFYEKGVKQRWQVPENIAASIKATDAPIYSGWFRAITAPTRALKAGATTYNPGFILRNKSRDVQAAAIVTDSFIQATAKRYGFSPRNAKNYSRKKIKEIYEQGGFGGASIFEDGQDILRNTMQRGKVSTNFRYDNLKSANPFVATRKINDMVEQSTRKEALARALSSGLSRKDAIWVSRNTPLDYSKMGTWMRPANQAVPFLNARVQGISKIPEAFFQNPERFSEAIMNTAVLPTILLHQHNRRYESYKYINQGIKELDWIIMTGEVPSINPYTGDEILVPQFVQIKRGEGQNLVSSPIRYWLEKEDEIDHRNVSQMMADMFGSNSPVDFGTYSRNQQNLWGSIAAQFGPIPTMVVGGSSEKHPYWGSDIIPEYRQDLHQDLQFGAKTSEMLKDIPKEFYRSGFAETLNISPGMLEFYTSVFGGMPQDVLKATDIAYGVIRGDKMGGLNVTDTTFETLSEIPVIKGFLNQTTYNVTEGDRRLISEVEMDLASDDREIKDRADEIIHKLRTIKDPKERRDYFNLLGDELTLDLITEISNRAGTTAIVDGLSKTDRVDVRAKVIQVKIQEMKEKGHSNKQIREFIAELTEKGILNQNVINELLK